MKKFLFYLPVVTLLVIVGFFGKGHGDLFGLNIAFGYGGGGGGGSPTVVPTLGTTPVTVSGGNTVTERNITLLFDVSKASMVAVSEKSNFSDATWETYSGTETFTLSEGYGVKTLYVKFRSSSGGEVSKQVTVTYVSSPKDDVPAVTTPTTPTIIPALTTPTTVAVTKSTPSFARDLKLSMTGDDIKALQQYLNNNGFPVAQTGVGSKGHETNYFGALTQGALIRFQKANNLTATGLLDLATRNYLGSVKTETVAVVNTPSLIKFARDLQLGTIGDDVKSLQQYLNSHGFVVTTAGPGSVGNETTKFGALTKQALIKYQQANNLPAFGFFGPLTRTFLNK